MNRVTLQWTETAKTELAKLPKKVRRGLLDKANELRDAENVNELHKPLTGSLRGYFRICYSRYRLIYSMEKKSVKNGVVTLHIIIRFVLAGVRKEGDKKDVYRLAQKLFDMGILDPGNLPDGPKDISP